MDRLETAMRELYTLEELAERDLRINRIDARIKLAVTVLYLVCLTSLGKYQLAGVILCSVYVMIGFTISDLRFGQTLKRVWLVVLLLGMFGLPNLFYDREPVRLIGQWTVTGGLLSFATLFLKGALTVLAAYLFIATTTIGKLCQALRRMHVPSVLTTQILLTYRYLGILLRQVSVSVEAYRLRAPGQKGIHFSAWGSMVGQILLASMDRAHELYESMLLSGFNGEFYDD